MTTTLLALASALCLASASVLEHRAVGAAGRGGPVTGLRLLGRLVRDGAWLCGAALALLGVVLQAAALRFGSLALVQPLLVSGLIFALLLGVATSHRRLPGREWVAALVVTGGLTLFLVSARPRSGTPGPDSLLLVCVAAAVCAVAGLLALARTVLREHRALLLGTGAGIAHGVAAALLKRIVDARASGGHVLVDGSSLLVAGGLAVCFAAALLLTQAAYAAGDLAASLPALTVVDPVVAIVIGGVAFGERLTASAASRASQVAGLLLMTVGVLRLAAWQARASSVHPHLEQPEST